MGAVLVLCRPFYCFADLMEQVAISPKAISLANTCTADPPGIASIHYNPAGLSKLDEGKLIAQGFILPWIRITSKFQTDPKWKGIFGEWGPQEGQIHDPVADTEDTNTSAVMFIPIYNHKINFAAGPISGLSSREPDSQWTFAITSYAPFLAGVNHSIDSPANYGARMLYLQHLIYAAPAASYQVTPRVSLGMSVGMGQTAFGTEVFARSPNEMVALTKVLGDATKNLEIPIVSELTLPPPWFGGGIGPYDQVAKVNFHLRDDFTPNYNLGLLWDVNDWLTYGAVYQSAIKSQLGGGYIFQYTESWQRLASWLGSSPLLLMTSGIFDLPTQAVSSQSGRATTDIEFPQRVQTGIKVKPTKRLSWLFDVNWANWSVLKENNVRLDQKIQMLQMLKMLGYTGGDQNFVLQQNMKDTIAWGTAFEYQVNEKLQLRCGYEYRPTSANPEYFGFTSLMPDLNYYGVGAGIKLPHDMVLDLALGWYNNPSYKVPNNTSKNLNATDFFYPVYNPYAGLNYEQETNIYLAAFQVQMPFALFIEQQKEMMQKQQEAIHHLVNLLNPFSHSPASNDPKEKKD